MEITVRRAIDLARRKLQATFKALAHTPAVGRHREISRRRHNGVDVIEIERETIVPVTISADRKDSGYHHYGNDWWVDPRCPASFKYLSIDAMYPDPYFAATTGHPTEDRAEDIVGYMLEMFANVAGRPLTSVLELGCGGGEITRALLRHGIDVIAVEGTQAGIRRLHQVGVPAERVLHHNLKFMPKLDRKFDLAMCTEVAEHIEPFFASKVVENCTSHADYVWFSAADRSASPHYHHLNEVDIEAWDNLFAHMNFPYLVELDGRQARASRLYLRFATP